MKAGKAQVVVLVVRGRRVRRSLGAYVTISEAAALLGTTRRTIYNKVRRRELKPRREGGRWVFARRELLEVLRRKGAGQERRAPKGRGGTLTIVGGLNPRRRRRTTQGGQP